MSSVFFFLFCPTFPHLQACLSALLPRFHPHVCCVSYTFTRVCVRLHFVCLLLCVSLSHVCVCVSCPCRRAFFFFFFSFLSSPFMRRRRVFLGCYVDCPSVSLFCNCVLSLTCRVGSSLGGFSVGLLCSLFCMLLFALSFFFFVSLAFFWGICVFSLQTTHVLGVGVPRVGSIFPSLCSCGRHRLV